MTLREAEPDRTHAGETPLYTELIQASIHAKADELFLSLSYAAALPERSEEGETIYAGFGIERSGEETFTLVAQLTAEGWKPFVSTRQGSRAYRGELIMRDRSLLFIAPWSEVGGQRPFKWGAASVLLETTGTNLSLDEKASDGIPDEETVAFPPDPDRRERPS